jgi:hypothetical protein
VVPASAVWMPLAVLDAAGAAVGTGVFQRPVGASQDHLVASVVPHIPFPTPIEVRAGRGGVAAAITGVNDGLLASSQREAAELVDMSGLIPHGPSGDGVRDVVAVLITTYSALRLELLARSEPGESKYTL